MGEVEESSPDIEIIITIRTDGIIQNSLEVNINKSRSVRELKQALASIKAVGIPDADCMRIFLGDLEMDNDIKIFNYDVETDDELFLEEDNKIPRN